MLADVFRVEDCVLKVTERRWEFSDRYRGEIDAHWVRRRQENPGFFNGRVFIMEPPRIEDSRIDARLVETDFADFLYWKDHDFPDRSVRDGFGSALIRARDGEVLLARQISGNLNAGLVYMPGGFIDPNDVDGDGRVDIASSVGRELMEETGLAAGDMHRQPGFLVTLLGPHVSIAVEYRVPLAAEALRARLLLNIARQEQPELSDFLVVRDASQLVAEDIAPFTRHAVAAVLDGV